LILCSQLDHFGFATISSPQVAGDSFAITVFAYDISNNIYPYNGPATLFASPGPQYGSKTITSFNSGVWQGFFRATLADTYALRCQDYSSPPHTGQSNSIVFDPNAPYRLLTILPGQTFYPGIDTGKIGNTIPQEAGSFFTVYFYLTDRWCNKIPGVSDSVRCSSTDLFRPIIDIRLTDGSSNISYAFRTAGNHRLYTRDLDATVIKSDTASLINSYAGSYSKLLVLFPGETHLAGDTTVLYALTPGKAGLPAPQYVLEDFSIIVYASDSMWNRTTASGNAIALSSSFPFSNPPPQILNNGETQFTLNFSTQGDNQNLSAQDLSNYIQSYQNYIAIEAKATDIVTAVDPDTVTPGQTANLYATIYDRTGAPIEGKSVQFTVLSGHGVILADYDTVYTDATGYCQSRFICQSGFFNEQDTIGVTADEYTDSSLVVFIMVPDSTVMEGNLVAFPNPFGSINSGRQTQFMYYLSSSCNVIYAIYDPFGNLVLREDIAPGQNGARQGINIITWDGRNDKHKRVATGVYYVVFKGYMHTNVFLEKRIKVGVIW
jgi:hypothetical protein